MKGFTQTKNLMIGSDMSEDDGTNDGTQMQIKAGESSLKSAAVGPIARSSCGFVFDSSETFSHHRKTKGGAQVATGGGTNLIQGRF
jgi:hypothetical protein